MDRQFFISDDIRQQMIQDGEAMYYAYGPRKIRLHWWSSLIIDTRGRIIQFFRSPVWIG